MHLAILVAPLAYHCAKNVPCLVNKLNTNKHLGGEELAFSVRLVRGEKECCDDRDGERSSLCAPITKTADHLAQKEWQVSRMLGM